MIIKPPRKYPANCKKCKNADLTATGEQAYCRKKGIFKRVKYFSCKMFEPKDDSQKTAKRGRVTRKAAPELTEAERLAIQRHNINNAKVSEKLRARYKKRFEKTE